jgi:hypothetical protein
MPSSNRSILRLTSDTTNAFDQAYQVADPEIAILSTLDYPTKIALPKINDGTTDTAPLYGVVGLFNHGWGEVEVLDNRGVRVTVVPGKTNQAFRAGSTLGSTFGVAGAQTSYGFIAPQWVKANVADTPGCWQGTTTYKQPIHVGTTLISTIDVDATSHLIAANTISTLLNPAGADGDSISCASTLGGANWAAQSSAAEIVLDTVYRNWFTQVSSKISSIAYQFEDGINRMIVGMMAGGVFPAVADGNVSMPTTLSTISVTSANTSDFEGIPEQTSIATGDSVDRVSGKGSTWYQNWVGAKYRMSSSEGHLGASLDFDFTVTLPAVESTLSTYQSSVGNFFVIENRANANQIFVEDNYGHRLTILAPYTGAAFQAVTTEISTADGYSGDQQWRLTNTHLHPGGEGFTNNKSSALKTTTVWAPMDITCYIPSVSCLLGAGEITSLSTATFSSDTDSTAIIAGITYVLGQFASMNSCMVDYINHNLNALMEITGAFDLATFTT